MDHKIEPRRQGRFVTCGVCGYRVISVRATRLIRKRHWRHMSWSQSPERLRLISPNFDPR